MARHAMVIDMNRCVGCGACVIACQEEWKVPDGQSRNWVIRHPPAAVDETLYYPFYVGMCNHCENASCLDACPTGATFRDQAGRVVVDWDLCIGCGYCIEACPYGARYRRDDVAKIDKCDLCAPRVDHGLLPVCVTTCPSHARIFGDLDDRTSAVSEYLRKGVRRLETERVPSEPNLFYYGAAPLLDQVFALHPPDPDRTEPPLPGRLWEHWLRPLAWAGVAVAFTGQGLAFFRQLHRRQDEESDHE